jgi:hypothetical protein
LIRTLYGKYTAPIRLGYGEHTAKRVFLRLLFAFFECFWMRDAGNEIMGAKLQRIFETLSQYDPKLGKIYFQNFSMRYEGLVFRKYKWF